MAVRKQDIHAAFMIGRRPGRFAFSLEQGRIDCFEIERGSAPVVGALIIDIPGATLPVFTDEAAEVEAVSTRLGTGPGRARFFWIVSGSDIFRQHQGHGGAVENCVH